MPKTAVTVIRKFC